MPIVGSAVMAVAFSHATEEPNALLKVVPKNRKRNGVPGYKNQGGRGGGLRQGEARAEKKKNATGGVTYPAIIGTKVAMFRI